jgi:hypothetical protein
LERRLARDRQGQRAALCHPATTAEGQGPVGKRLGVVGLFHEAVIPTPIAQPPSAIMLAPLIRRD